MEAWTKQKPAGSRTLCSFANGRQG